MKRFPFVVVVAALFAACGSSPPPLHAADYARNCGADSDCMAITDTDVCECPLCSNRAINAGDAQKYADTLKAYEAYCKGTACSSIACAQVTAYCDSGTCEVH